MTGSSVREILFISGSGGLGHATRDLAIARALRRAVSGARIRWLAAPPASDVIQEAGEELLPHARDWADETMSDLANAIVSHIGTEVTHKTIPVDGAERLSEIAKRLMEV